MSSKKLTTKSVYHFLPIKIGMLTILTNIHKYNFHQLFKPNMFLVYARLESHFFSIRIVIFRENN